MKRLTAAGIEAAFWANVDKNGPTPNIPNWTQGPCWLWTGGISRKGYGELTTGEPRRAHRYAYTRLVGAIPDKLTLDHLCRNRACANPAHLEPVTNRVNVLRGNGTSATNARKTHCPNGHPLEGSNLDAYQQKLGKRSCRECRKAQNGAYWATRKAPAKEGK